MRSIVIAGVASFLACGMAAGQSVLRVPSDLSNERQPSDAALITADGRFVVFNSRRTDLVPGDLNDSYDVYVFDRLAGTVSRANPSIPGAYVVLGGLSRDGRFIVYTRRDSFARPILVDRASGESTVVSVNDAGEAANAWAWGGPVSDDGRYVVFSSSASNLVPGLAHTCEEPGTLDPNDYVSFPCPELFVRDRQAGTTSRVSVDAGGAPLDGSSTPGGISADGRFIAFTTRASHHRQGESRRRRSVYVYDQSTRTATIVGVGTNTEGGDLSADGRFVAFGRFRYEFPDEEQSFVFDRATGTTLQVSTNSIGAGANGESFAGHLSSDGRYVAFESYGFNLVGVPTNGVKNVYLRDRDADANGIFDEPGGAALDRVSVSWLGGPPDDNCSGSTVTDDGRFVAYVSAASNLVEHDSNQQADVFLFDREPCRTGNVDAASGLHQRVLFVNGRRGTNPMRLVTLSIGEPITVTFLSAPQGPSPGAYVLWVWNSAPIQQFFLTPGNESLGCVCNPTSLRSRPSPRPILCVHGGVDAFFCGTSHTVAHSPASVPWTLTRSMGFRTPITLTLQGLVEDASATNSLGLSVSNAILLLVR